MTYIQEYNFLHITYYPKESAQITAFNNTLDKAKDWIHYLPNCWVIKTRKSTDEWYLRLKSVIGPTDNIFIVRIELSDRQGWLPKWVWEWFHKQK